MTDADESTTRARDLGVVWHDVECGGFEADLALWEELAGAADGPLLELGCGTGRVALHLARRGHRVTGIDSDAALIDALRVRAAAEGIELRAECMDAIDFSLDGGFRLVLAPMQLIQLLPGAAARRACLRAAASHLLPSGVFALAIVEGAPTGIAPSPLLPDVRDRDGWVYSSMPLGAVLDGDSLLVERLRQLVDPDGRLSESRNVVRLQLLSAANLEREGGDAGLQPAGRRQIAATESHIGSTVVLLEA